MLNKHNFCLQIYICSVYFFEHFIKNDRTERYKLVGVISFSGWLLTEIMGQVKAFSSQLTAGRGLE